MAVLFTMVGPSEASAQVTDSVASPEGTVVVDPTSPSELTPVPEESPTEAIEPTETTVATAEATATDVPTTEPTEPPVNASEMTQPVVAISFSQKYAAVGEIVTVTTTIFDPSTGPSGGVGSFTIEIPDGAEMNEIVPNIVCDPACLGTATIAVPLSNVVGLYTPGLTEPTTITVTFSFTVGDEKLPGQSLGFYATATVVNGVFVGSDTQNVFVRAASAPLTISASNMAPMAGDTITITASLVQDGWAQAQPGRLAVTIPTGARVVSGSATYTGCAVCAGMVDAELPQLVSIGYVNNTLDQLDVGVTFQVAIGVDVAPGTEISFIGSGALANGTPTGPTATVVSVAAPPLATEPLMLNAVAGEPTTGNLSEGIGGGVAPYGFSIVAVPTQGELILNQDGTFTYTPDVDAEGTDQFTYAVTDSAVVQSGECNRGGRYHHHLDR